MSLCLEGELSIPHSFFALLMDFFMLLKNLKHLITQGMGNKDNKTKNL